MVKKRSNITKIRDWMVCWSLKLESNLCASIMSSDKTGSYIVNVCSAHYVPTAHCPQLHYKFYENDCQSTNFYGNFSYRFLVFREFVTNKTANKKLIVSGLEWKPLNYFNKSIVWYFTIASFPMDLLPSWRKLWKSFVVMNWYHSMKIFSSEHLIWLRRR